MSIALLALLFAVALPGKLLLAAVRMARRARTAGRTGDHPHCRQCGYDLTASPRDGRCPECGQELRQRGAVVIGRPAPSRPRLAAAGAVALVAAALAVFASPPVLRGVDWFKAEPTFLLRWQTARGDVPAALELSRRLAAGELWDGQVRAAAEAALAVQADPAAKWHPAFGDIVEGARDRGALGDAAWHDYARHAAEPSLESLAAATVRPGDLVPLRLWLNPSRIDGSGFRLPDAKGTTTVPVGSRSDPPSSPWPAGEMQFSFRHALAGHALGDQPMTTYDDPLGDRRQWSGLPSRQRTVASDSYAPQIRVPDNQPPGADVVLAAWRQTFDVPLAVVEQKIAEADARVVPTSHGVYNLPQFRALVEQRNGQHTGVLFLKFGPRQERIYYDLWLLLPDGQRMGTPTPWGGRSPAGHALIGPDGGKCRVQLHPDYVDVLRRAGGRRVDVLLESDPDLRVRPAPPVERLIISGVPIVYRDEEPEK